MQRASLQTHTCNACCNNSYVKLPGPYFRNKGRDGQNGAPAWSLKADLLLKLRAIKKIREKNFANEPGPTDRIASCHQWVSCPPAYRVETASEQDKPPLPSSSPSTFNILKSGPDKTGAKCIRSMKAPAPDRSSSGSHRISS